MSELVRVEREGPIAILTIDNPPVNLVTFEMTRQLTERLRELESDKRVRALVIIGAGERAFCAGSDIKEFPLFFDQGVDVSEAKIEPENDAYDRLAQFRTPTIAALNGNALGGGLELAVCCDLIVAREGVVLGLPEVGLGVIPGSGGTVRVPRRIGMARAAQLILVGDPIDAETAFSWGLINAVVPGDELLDRVLAFAERIVTRSPSATALAKKALADSLYPSGPEARNTFKTRIEAAFADTDIREGVRAFLAKETPEFGAR